MRKKFICQSADVAGTMNKALLVHDEYNKGEGSQPEYHFINNVSEQYQQGDVWLVEHTLLRRGHSNGPSWRKSSADN